MGHSHIPQEAELGKDRTFRHPGAQVPSCSCGAFEGIPGFPGCPGGDGASHRYLTFAAALTLLCTCPPSPTNLSKREEQSKSPRAGGRALSTLPPPAISSHTAEGGRHRGTHSRSGLRPGHVPALSPPRCWTDWAVFLGRTSTDRPCSERLRHGAFSQ